MQKCKMKSRFQWQRKPPERKREREREKMPLLSATDSPRFYFDYFYYIAFFRPHPFELEQEWLWMLVASASRFNVSWSTNKHTHTQHHLIFLNVFHISSYFMYYLLFNKANQMKPSLLRSKIQSATDPKRERDRERECRKTRILLLTIDIVLHLRLRYIYIRMKSPVLFIIYAYFIFHIPYDCLVQCCCYSFQTQLNSLFFRFCLIFVCAHCLIQIIIGNIIHFLSIRLPLWCSFAFDNWIELNYVWIEITMASCFLMWFASTTRRFPTVYSCLYRCARVWMISLALSPSLQILYFFYVF